MKSWSYMVLGPRSKLCWRQSGGRSWVIRIPWALVHPHTKHPQNSISITREDSTPKTMVIDRSSELAKHTQAKDRKDLTENK